MPYDRARPAIGVRAHGAGESNRRLRPRVQVFFQSHITTRATRFGNFLLQLRDRRPALFCMRANDGVVSPVNGGEPVSIW